MNGFTNPIPPSDIQIEEPIIDTLAPEYQKLLDEGFSIVTTRDEAALEAWFRTAPKQFQQQLLEDIVSILHSRKVHLIRSLFGVDAVRRLSREKKDAVVRALAQAATVNAANESLQTIDQTLKIKPSVDFAIWHDSAIRIIHGLESVNSLQLKPHLQEHQEHLERFHTFHPVTVQNMRQQLEQAFLEIRPGVPLAKSTVDKLANVLSKSGYPQQIVKELTNPQNHHRLLRAANRIYTPLAVVEQHFGNQGAQETALRQRLQQMQTRYGPSW